MRCWEPTRTPKLWDEPTVPYVTAYDLPVGYRISPDFEVSHYKLTSLSVAMLLVG